MKSDPDLLSAAPVRSPDHGHEGLGYPFRLVTVFAAALALCVIWLVLPLEPDLAWTYTAAIIFVALLLVAWCTLRRALAREQGVQVLAALGAATADIPVKLRARMPTVLVAGDGLPALFDRGVETRHVHVGDGAIWLRVDRARELPQLAVAVMQWRAGRAPDGIVLSIAPALHPTEDMLAQNLRVARQAAADMTRMLGVCVPGYVAVYQRLTGDKDPGGQDADTLKLALPHWYGVSSASGLMDAERFQTAVRAAEDEVRSTAGNRMGAERAAALSSVVGWTQRVVIGTLTDRLQPAMPWPLSGAGWIDCGPASGQHNPWVRDVLRCTRVTRADANASTLPWPLPQPVIGAMPRRLRMSPRLAAFAHALALVACAAAVAFWGAARNNEALLNQVGADLGRYSMIPVTHDMARRAALQTLAADRDRLDRYARTGIPLRLSFGMYRGPHLIPMLDSAIASYVPPPAAPSVITLDSMSLFDSGKAQLSPGSTRAMVGALELIHSHPGKRILVAGYTDNVGNADSNLRLSEARAEAVREWLVNVSGIPATQFAIQGYGDTRPVASNDTSDGRARNRRVEITLVPDTGVRPGAAYSTK